MPTVARYQKKEQLQPLPSVRLNPNAADEEAFGGGPSAAAAASATRDAFQEGTKIAIQAKQKADEVAVLDSDLKLSQAQTELEIGAKKMQGKNAAGAIDYVDGEWKKKTEEIRKGLGNNEQRAAFDRSANVRYSEMNKTVQGHMASEFTNYDSETTKAYVANARNQAALHAGNPDMIALSLYQQQEAILGHGHRAGWSDDQIANAITEARGETHATIIDAMIGADQVDAAEKYYDRHKSQLVGDKAKSITSKYIRAQAKALDEQKRFELGRKQTENYKQALVKSFQGAMPLSELQRMFRAGDITPAQYNYLESKAVNPLLQELNKKLKSDPETFNAIREAQILKSASKDEILGMISKAQAEGKLRNNAKFGNDPAYLTKLTEDQFPASPRDQRIVAQANNLRDFGGRYFKKSVMDKAFGGDQAPAAQEEIVREFHRRIDEKKADGEDIDEIAKQVMHDFIKKDYPEVSRFEDMPHIIRNVDGKTERLFNPEQKTKVKPSFTIIRNAIQAAAEPKPKKKEK